jgi:hypothetical protein
MTTHPNPSVTLQPRVLAPRDLADLTTPPVSRPCVSVLLPTTPCPRMAANDRARLRGLVDEAGRQLLGQAGRARLVRRLGDLVTRAVDQPTDRGLAIYVNQEIARTFRLPLPVTARSVVEPTFATRALFTVMHRMPPYVLLVLHPTCAHLYQGGDGTLRSVGDRDVFRGARAVRVPRQGDPGGAGTSTDATDDFLRGTDHLLGTYRAERPSPLVLAGDPDLLDRFCDVSRHLDRLAGCVPLDESRTALGLAGASAEVVVRYLGSRRDEALGRLRAALATRPGDVARGMAECWRAVHEKPPSMLLVEESYIHPGRAEALAARATGDVPSPGDGTEGAREMVHDLVDDLMEVVILRGGQLALVEDGDLGAHGRVALISGVLGPTAPGDRETPRP